VANGVVKSVYVKKDLASEYAALGQETERSFSYFVNHALREYKGDNRVIKRRRPIQVNANPKETNA
jgi:hypothetical protein